MLVDLDVPVLDIYDRPLKDGKKDIRVTNVFVAALVSNVKEDKVLTGEDKVAMFELAKKIAPGGKVELSADELGFLRERIGMLFGTTVVGRMSELFQQWEK